MNHGINEPALIASGKSSWVVDTNTTSTCSEYRLVGVDHKYNARRGSLLPSKKINLRSNNAQFLFLSGEVNVIDKVIVTMGFDF
ncbi:hypothetical protein JK229_12450 [Pantoea dispersa]|uniref:hypothetical protein n=1 Tax=Pantoea dispersa TaxID=59814 RepID=UPI001BAC54F7|nr:hypothetical protein [Pantoea dispersa]MBS0905939.1 hypothetical protein [Pantoea dispersa]